MVYFPMMQNGNLDFMTDNDHTTYKKKDKINSYLIFPPLYRQTLKF